MGLCSPPHRESLFHALPASHTCSFLQNRCHGCSALPPRSSSRLTDVFLLLVVTLSAFHGIFLSQSHNCFLGEQPVFKHWRIKGSPTGPRQENSERSSQPLSRAGPGRLCGDCTIAQLSPQPNPTSIPFPEPCLIKILHTISGSELTS